MSSDRTFRKRGSIRKAARALNWLAFPISVPPRNLATQIKATKRRDHTRYVAANVIDVVLKSSTALVSRHNHS